MIKTAILKTPMPSIGALSLAALVFAGVPLDMARADSTQQTNQNNIRTPQSPGSPYSSPYTNDWAKPGGTFHNDPRYVDPNSSRSQQRRVRCPAPTLYDPASGRCK
jgi:hypothetical protein